MSLLPWDPQQIAEQQHFYALKKKVFEFFDVFLRSKILQFVKLKNKIVLKGTSLAEGMAERGLTPTSVNYVVRG